MNDFFNLVGDYYNNLTNEESILLALVGVLVFSLGVIVGWIVQGLKTRRYKKELLLLRKDRDEFEARYRAHDKKLKELAKEIQALSQEKVAALDRVQTLEREATAHNGELTTLRQTNEQLRLTNQENEGTIGLLNDQVAALKVQNDQLAADFAAAKTSGQSGAGAGASVGATEQSNENLNAYIATAEARFRELEQRISWLADENTELRNATAPNNPFTGHQPVVDDSLSPSTSEPLVIRADTTEPGARKGDHGNTEVIVQTTPSVQVPAMGASTEERVDDLTLIDNIGPFLQQKLNEADIYRYEQIASWTTADIATYTGLIGYIPGIIERDDWVGQAKGLAMSEAAASPVTAETEVALPESAAPPAAPSASAPAAPPQKDERDNLKIVEGIGPKIQSILYEAGIETLTQLAETDPEALRDILIAASPRMRGHDPKTWPVQAGLAADGKIDELKAWQKELKGGR